MRKTVIIAAGLLMSAGVLTGCGSDDKGGSSAGGDYCDTLKSAAGSITAFTADDATPDFSKFDDFLDKAHDLADEAPSDVKDDWTTMLGAMDDLTAALEDVGLSFEEFGQIASGGAPPADLDTTKLAELAPKLQKIASADVQAAGDAISKQAKDDCGVDLSKTS